MKNEDAQQKYIEFQMASQQLNKLNQQFSLINNKILELKNLDQGLSDLGLVKQNEEILIPFGAGILIKASIKDSKDVLMNVGADIVVKKSTADSKKIIQQQITELETALEETEKEIINLSTGLEMLKKELEDSA